MAPDQERRSDAAWDRIGERLSVPAEDPGMDHQVAVVDHDDRLIVPLFAAAWADIVCVVAVCTLSLLALALMGHHARLAALPWGLGLGTLWWLAAATATVVVRRGTPGMLMAGVVAAGSIAPGRIPGLLLAALMSCCLLGLPALLGRQRSLLRAASGHELVAADPG